MNSIAMKIRNARIKGGSLIFETPKKSFKLDQNYYPESFTVAKRFEANFLVEEYMLLANQKVGEVLVEHLRTSALLRRHKFPSDKKI
jgi:exoribonuclease R